MNTTLPRLGLIIALASLAACRTVGPDYALPEGSAFKRPQANAAFIDTQNPDVAANQALPDRWWSLYNDPVLDGLIAQALRDNVELKAADAHLRRAAAVYEQAMDAGGFEYEAEAGISRRQLDGIALSRGPGAFTGVRLAIAIAQGIALALDRPLLPVSTLQVLALRAPADEAQILSVIDARMGEVYAARFERVDGLPVACDTERVCAPAAVVLPDGLQAYGVGSGFAAADGALVAQLGAGLRGFDATALPRASDVLTLAVPAFSRGEAIAAERVEPAYLRDNVALTLVEQQAAREAKAKANG
ncbi:MAG TPA: tRNA (adenosine(37)-N6)-threonylcarbamoyltransferase complex dimerization subunit type 1 TsaB [Stenotrophomonas sp.]|nr:tRNA (adenosine(37)-N6)-threonylcarbamoyltransferase complex dimerization subunit type 1 TsaB [Stenotrophomonas sp.]